MFNLPGFCVRPGLSTVIVMRSRDEVKKRIGFDLTVEEYFGMQHLLSSGGVLSLGPRLCGSVQEGTWYALISE